MVKRPQHVVLLGDSIFDNGSYVPGELAVAQQLQSHLPAGWKVTLLAVDGDAIADVPAQLDALPADADCLIVSVGGNDALRQSGILQQPVETVGEALVALARLCRSFREDYASMLAAILARDRPTLVCTVYDRIPFTDSSMREMVASSLPIFNDIILREAIESGVSVLDLRCICTDPSDYSDVSPIEPSVVGGAKISAAIAGVVQRSDLPVGTTWVFGSESRADDTRTALLS
jgi:lysophospholipase L1-like esterase